MPIIELDLSISPTEVDETNEEEKISICDMFTNDFDFCLHLSESESISKNHAVKNKNLFNEDASFQPIAKRLR
jgi:hypothetical protein